MIVLNERQIQQSYTMENAIADVKEVLKSKYEQSIATPLRTVIDFTVEDASILYMPSADFNQQYASNKIVSIFPNNPANGMATTQGIIVLNDASNGQPLALLNASYLTRLRTGALSAIATDYLARKEATSLTVIGTGGMAYEQVLGVLAVRQIKTIQLVNRTVEKAELFKLRLQKQFPQLAISVEMDVDLAVEKADIINCATRSNVAVFKGEFVKKGTHINGVGSYLPQMREIDESLITVDNKIVVDDLHGVEEEAGEFIAAVKNNQWSFTEVHSSLEQLVVGETQGREKADEITIFKSVGAAYFDLAVAIGVYKQALSKDVGITVEL